MKRGYRAARRVQRGDDEGRSAKKKYTHSKYTFMIDTRARPGDLFSGGELAFFLDEVMQQYAPKAPELLTFNTQGDDVRKIKNVHIKYAIEGMEPNPNPRLTKKGLPDKRGGTVHLHGTIHIVHKSNINIDYDAVNQFIAPMLENMTTKKPFISTFRLTGADLTEPYMTKEDRYEDGWHWTRTEY